MIPLEIQFFSFNKILLLVIGLWPYQQSKLTRLQFICFSTILTAGVIFQLTTLMTSKYTSNLVRVLSSASLFIVSLIKYNSFCINIEAVKDLLMQFQHIYSQLKDKNEVAIIKEYSCSARRYTIILTIFAVSTAFVIITSQYWLNTLVVLPKNVSQLRHLPIMMEYFIDQEKYFYLILLHFNAVICVGWASILAIGTMLITLMQCICGMFRIACYRIKHAININIRQNITLKNKILMTEGIICAVDIHRQAMKLSKHLLSTFEIMMFCLIVCGVACLTLNLFQIFQIASSENNVEEFFFPLLCVSVSIIYMFIANYIGQDIIDHNNDVLFTAYNVQWYRAPLHIQRMILFLLQRVTKEFTLNVGGLFSASIECFATLVKSSVSYFTVIYSTR
ncbi:uncharacterized protein LOC143898472 [Temnothorax americanus]|uniref:uncharacterized protein LOC143898472 n=1 Tax=Temnothorax americanus TaxID=1964332 RepID=UPI004067F992